MVATVAKCRSNGMGERAETSTAEVPDLTFLPSNENVGVNG